MRRFLAVVPVVALALVLGGLGAAQASDGALEPGTRSSAKPPSRSAFAPPSGSITLGQVATNVDGSCGSATIAAKMNTLNGATNPYTVPASGVLTSFSYNAGTVPGGAALQLLSPTGTADTYDVVARSALQSVVANTLNTFPIRIPVQPGWQLGLATSVADMNCVYVGVTGDVVGIDTSFAATTDPQGVFPNLLTARVNVAAELEPDADGDGHGDLTQDLCPQAASTQTACPPPNTTIKKAPSKRTTKRKVKLTFSSVAGATYTCKVDNAAPVACSSPFSKKLKVGRHSITVTATTPTGIVDPTPPTVRFKIVKP